MAIVGRFSGQPVYFIEKRIFRSLDASERSVIKKE
jgi:hypothetical protein